MAYSVKEIYYTLQGEGAQTGRPAVFCRFSGCNLWSGLEKDRTTAVCNFCDTDFVGTDGPGGGKFSNPNELANQVMIHWPNNGESGDPLVVCTGGEPLLQLDQRLVDAFHETGLEVAVETNGTVPLKANLDWICVSPKSDTELELTSGDEIKLVYPQLDAPPERFVSMQFDHRFLQPMDGPMRDDNTKLALRYCLENPIWKLSLQTHKYLGID